MGAEDIMVWPDGGWCYGSEFEEYSLGRSDDFEVLRADTKEWEGFLVDQM